MNVLSLFEFQFRKVQLIQGQPSHMLLHSKFQFRKVQLIPSGVSNS